MKRKNKKNEKGNFSDGLNVLIVQGTAITTYASGMVHREGQDEVDNMFETHKDFQNWKMDVRDFFLKYKLYDEYDFFSEGDSVPLLTGGIEYSYIDSHESQELLKNIREETKEKLKFLRESRKRGEQGDERNEDEGRLKSIHLITTQLPPKKIIFLVFDEWYRFPIRFCVKNKEGGETAIKILYNIAYIADVPESKVSYDKRLSDNINNGLFKKKSVSDFMKTNKKKKPTLVVKSGGLLVLKNEVPVKTGIVKNVVPTQDQSLYRDKT